MGILIKTINFMIVISILVNCGICCAYADDSVDVEEEFLNKYFVEDKTDHTEYIFKNGKKWKSGNLITSFDVRQDGTMAIAFSDDMIGIFDSKMKLIKAMQVKGGVEYIMWIGDELFLYSSESPTIMINVNNAECTSYRSKPTDDEVDYYFLRNQHSTDEYRYYLSKSKTRIVEAEPEPNNYVFYPYILRFDRNNNLEVVYDAGRRYWMWRIMAIIPIVAAIVVLLTLLYRKYQICPREIIELNNNQMPARYTINETKKEYFDLQAFMRGKEASDEGMYRYNPLWILTTEGGDSDMSGRWVGDTITGSDIRPLADYTDISDRL